VIEEAVPPGPGDNPSRTVARPVVVGVAGGTGSGKTTVVSEILGRLGRDRVRVIHHDSYYRDFSHLAPEERDRINFDHPRALETTLLVSHLGALLRDEPVEVPVYDFTTHTRARETRTVTPSPVLIVDGILVLAEPELRALMDIRLFVDTDADVRFIRRLRRDMRERGRSLESVVVQYERSVRPMHLEFVEPSKRFADVVIPEGGENRVAVDMVVSRLRSMLARWEV
jgi:uridine kinase